MSDLVTQPPAVPPLNPGDSARYLSRLGVAAPEAPTMDALSSLHQAHLLRIPFENLDIGLGRHIRLDSTSLVRKVLGQGRGGYCYELNGLFAALLQSVGYAAQLMSARVTAEGGGVTDDFDHLALMVTSPFVAEPRLVDVGFGEAFREPLPLRDQFSRSERGKLVGLLQLDDDRWAYREDHGTGWQTQYVLTVRPRRMDDFEERNRWQQTSPDSHFTQQRVVSIATESGRVTLSNSRLITTTARSRSERPVTADELGGLLAERFGIVLEEADVRRLIALP